MQVVTLANLAHSHTYYFFVGTRFASSRDTGCNTSIILRSLLGKLLSVAGPVPKVKILHDATVLTAASGENMKANEF